MLARPDVFFAGQMTGVEGYVESAGSGMVAGINAARRALGMDPVIYPEEMMLGAMAAYVSRGGVGAFAPMNANFGIVPQLGYRVRGGKAAKNEKIAERALALVDQYAAGKTSATEEEAVTSDSIGDTP